MTDARIALEEGGANAVQEQRQVWRDQGLKYMKNQSTGTNRDNGKPSLKQPKIDSSRT